MYDSLALLLCGPPAATMHSRIEDVLVMDSCVDASSASGAAPDVSGGPDAERGGASRAVVDAGTVRVMSGDIQRWASLVRACCSSGTVWSGDAARLKPRAMSYFVRQAAYGSLRVCAAVLESGVGGGVAVRSAGDAVRSPTSAAAHRGPSAPLPPPPSHRATAGAPPAPAAAGSAVGTGAAVTAPVLDSVRQMLSGLSCDGLVSAARQWLHDGDAVSVECSEPLNFLLSESCPTLLAVVGGALVRKCALDMCVSLDFLRHRRRRHACV
jgi:hypothetical protein